MKVFCIKCGKQIADDALFCPYCGNKVNGMVPVEEAKEIVPASQTAPVSQTTPVASAELEREGLKIYLNDLRTLETVINELPKEATYDPPHEIEKGYHISAPEYDVTVGKRIDVNYYGVSCSKRHWAEYKSEETCKFMYFDIKWDKSKGFTVKFRWEELDSDEIKRMLIKPELKSRHHNDSLWTPYCSKKDGIFSYYGHPYSLKCYEFFVKCYNEFMDTYEEEYRKEVERYDERYKRTLDLIKQREEYVDLLKEEYSLNIIPNKFRNIESIYYITDYFESSNESLSSILFHLDLDEIKTAAQEIINNQQKELMAQAVLISQNENLMAQNNQILGELSSIGSAMAKTSQWTEIAAKNADLYYRLSCSDYFRNT